MKRRRFLPALAVSLMLPALAGCAAFVAPREKPEVTLAGLALRDIGPDEQRWTLRLRVRNPNPLDLPVDALDFTVDIDDRPFAAGNSTQPLRIPAEGEAIVEVDARSDLGSLFRQLRDYRRWQRRGGLDYRIRGTLDAGRYGRLPFERRGRLELPAGAPPAPAGERT